MTEQYDAIERQMGIVSYASSMNDNTGFAAVLKARYSDFLVHEVGIDGTMARLSSLHNNLAQESITSTTSTSTSTDANANANVVEASHAATDGAARTADGETKKRNAQQADITLSTSATSENLSHDNDAKKPKVETEQAAAAENAPQIQTQTNTNNDATTTTTSAIANVIDIDIDIEAAMSEIKSKLEPLVGEEAAKGAAQMLHKWETCQQEQSIDTAQPQQEPIHVHVHTNPPPPPKGTDDDSKHYTFPLVEDKQTRKSIHMLLKSDLFRPFCMADTFEKRVRIWHKMFETHMPNHGLFVKDERFKNMDKNKGKNGKGKGKMEWPKDRPNYIKFSLYKENIDTGTAAKDVGRTLRLPPKGGRGRGFAPGSGGLGYAGMKDKRGCTTQFCTLYRKTPEDVMVLNRERENDRRQGGGNSKFGGSTVLRVGDFSYVNQELRLGLLRGNRFDIVLRNICVKECGEEMSVSLEERLSNISSTLKSAAKCMKESGFINYFGMQRFGKFHDTHLVGVAILKGDFEMACDIIMRIKEHENEKCIATREKWANRFAGVDMEDDSSVKDAEMKCAKVLSRELGRFMNCETSIVCSLSRTPRDYKKAFGSIAKHMRSMFLHAYQSYIWNKAASHRIVDGGGKEVRVGDLVLVQDSGLADGGNGTSGLKGKAVKEVSQDDVEMCKYSITDVVLPLAGSKIVYPTDSTGDIYEDVLAEDGLTKQDFENIKDRELAVGGDYRKVICKPSDVDYEIKLYNDPLQPLIKTDLMNVHNASLECVDVTSDDATLVDKSDEDGRKLVGMVIGFTLPPSAYATIALRELMRRPTSSQYQTELLLEGDCEGNVGKTNKSE